MVPLGSVCSEDDDADENYVSMSAATTEPPVAPKWENIFIYKLKVEHPGFHSSWVPGYLLLLLTLPSGTPTTSRWPPSPRHFPSNPASWQVTWPPWGGRSPHRDTWVFATPPWLPSPRRLGGTHRTGRLRPFLLPSTAIWNRSAKGFHPLSLQTSRLAKPEVGPDRWQIIDVAVILCRFTLHITLTVPKVAKTFCTCLSLFQVFFFPCFVFNY